MAKPAFRLQWAARALKAGGVLAYPTEAVWGLGCDPGNEKAVERILQLKDRPRHKGLILVAAAEEQFDWLLSELTDDQRSRLSCTWPGPVTWLVPHRGQVPDGICGEHDSVAIRVSAHPGVIALCEAFGGPLVSTSANPAGAEPARHQYQLQQYFGAELDGVVPGTVGAASQPSMIRDLLSDRILRPA